MIFLKMYYQNQNYLQVTTLYTLWQNTNRSSAHGNMVCDPEPTKKQVRDVYSRTSRVYFRFSSDFL